MQGKSDVVLQISEHNDQGPASSYINPTISRRALAKTTGYFDNDQRKIFSLFLIIRYKQ